MHNHLEAGTNILPIQDSEPVGVSRILDAWEKFGRNHRRELYVPPLDTQGREIAPTIRDRINTQTLTIIQGPVGFGTSGALNDHLQQTLDPELRRKGSNMFTMPSPQELTNSQACFEALNKQLRAHGLAEVDFNGLANERKLTLEQSATSIGNIFFQHLWRLQREAPMNAVLLYNSYGPSFTKVAGDVRYIYSTLHTIQEHNIKIDHIVSANSVNEGYPSKDRHFQDVVHLADFSSKQADLQLGKIARLLNPDMSPRRIEAETQSVRRQFPTYSWSIPGLNSRLFAITSWRREKHGQIKQEDVDAAVCRTMKCTPDFLNVFRYLLHQFQEHEWTSDTLKDIFTNNGLSPDDASRYLHELYFRGILEGIANKPTHYSVRPCFAEAAQITVKNDFVIEGNLFDS